MSELPRSAQKVADAAAVHDLTLEIVEYPDGTRTAADAAEAVGCEVGQIVKSLIFGFGDGLILALTSGRNRVDADRLAELAGGGACTRADADAVRAVTGYAIGGVPPFGHDTAVPAFFDPDLLTYEVVWAAAGTPRHVFPIDPNRLLDLTGATVGPFTET
jgi:prolyl-tRNA editing enzyme YbaK/EbsC (Cys-tRNA(Pro) deacylase)